MLKKRKKEKFFGSLLLIPYVVFTSIKMFSSIARWCHFTFTNVHVDFFSHLLKRCRKCQTKQRKIITPPFSFPCGKKKPCVFPSRHKKWKMCTRQMSDQTLQLRLHLSKAFNGKTEIADNAEFSQPTGRAALQAAKTKSISKPSLQSRITIGFGEGRATRECKFKWIPLYDSSSNGVSTFRVYVSKVHL